MESERNFAAAKRHSVRWISAPLKYARYLLGYGLAIVFVAFAVPPIIANWELFYLQLSASTSWGTVLCLVMVCGQTIRAFYLKQLTESVGDAISARESLCLVGATTMLEFIAMPIVGTAYRGWYLKRAKRVPLNSFTAGITVFAIARLLVWGIPATAYLFSIGLRRGGAEHYLTSMALALLFIMAGAWLGQRLLHLLAGLRTTRLSQIADQWLRVTVSKRIAISAGASMLGCMLLELVGFYVTFRAANLPITLIDCIGLTSCYQLSGIVGITPGGIGVQEAASLLLSGPLGIGASEMLIVLTLIRVARTLISAAIGGPCWWFLAKVA